MYNARREGMRRTLNSAIVLLLLQQHHVRGEGESGVKVNKCCSEEEYFNVSTERCERYGGNTKNLSFRNWTVDESLVHHSANGSFIVGWKEVKYTPDCSGNILTKHIRLEDLGLNRTGGMSYSFTYNGVLLESSAEGEGRAMNYEPDQYCIDPTLDGMILRICPVSCDDTVCIRKCCPLGQHVDLSNDGACVPSTRENSESWQLPLYSPVPYYPRENSSSTIRSTSSAHYTSLHPKDHCIVYLSYSTGWMNVTNSEDPFKVLTNGSRLFLSHSFPRRWTLDEHSTDYCYDGAVAPGSSPACENEFQVMYICFEEWEYEEDSEDWLGVVAKVTLVIAVICLGLATILMALTVDGASLHSWTRLSFISTEFLFMCLGVVVHFSDIGSHQRSCTVVGVGFHFLGLMTVCWVSVMNFDLWWTFKALNVTSTKKKNMVRYACYAAVAIGLPLLIITIALIIDGTKPASITAQELSEESILCRDDPSLASELARVEVDKTIYPGYGVEKCSLSTEALGAYWYGPLCFLLLANLLFFLGTTFMMNHWRKLSRRVSGKNSNSSKQTWHMFAKIFIISGLTWNVEMIGWLLDPSYRFDIIHNVQAVALFIIFVCKRETVNVLGRRFPSVSKVASDSFNMKKKKMSIASTSAQCTELNTGIVIPRKLSTASTNSSTGTESASM